MSFQNATTLWLRQEHTWDLIYISKHLDVGSFASVEKQAKLIFWQYNITLVHLVLPFPRGLIRMNQKIAPLC